MASIDNAKWSQERVSHWLCAAWDSGFRTVLKMLDLQGALADIELDRQPPAQELWQQWQEPLWYRLPTGLPEGAAFSIGCASDTARGLARVIAGEEELPDTTVLETYLEIVKQSANVVAAAFSENAGTTVEFAQASKDSAPRAGSMGFQLQFELESANHLLAVVPTESMLEWILSTDRAAQAPKRLDDAAETASNGAQEGQEEQSSSFALSSTATHNLELLMEVDLDLSVSFGRTQLLLEDVLKLATGSIVELNRSATDPVDVLVNDAVVARGEVVVVDGNYGIRITEVVSRKERIRSIL